MKRGSAAELIWGLGINVANGGAEDAPHRVCVCLRVWREGAGRAEGRHLDGSWLMVLTGGGIFSACI